MMTMLMTTAAPEATWWQLAPYLAVGVAVIVAGLKSSRKGPR